MAQTARPALSSAAPVEGSTRHHDSTGANPMSSGDFSADHRRNAAARFARALHRNFASPAQVARAFSVDPSTAEGWWEGNHQPLLWVVTKAMDTPALHPVLDDLRAKA